MSEQSQGPGWWQASDGKWYPPQPESGAAPPPPPVGQQPAGQPQFAAAPEKKGMPGCLKYGLIGLVVAVVLGVGCTALLSNSAEEVSKDLDEQEADKLNDAKITSCEVDQAGFMAAQVEITNNSSERSNYDVTVSYTSKDGSEQYGTGDAFVQALEPDQKITETAQSLDEPPGEFKCKITDVTRFSDE